VENLHTTKKGALKGLLSRFRSDKRGAMSIEIGVSIAFMGLGFVGLLSTVNSVDNAHSGQRALNDIVMTVRGMPDIDNRPLSEIEAILNNVAADNLRSNQQAELSIARTCGCALEQVYNAQMCEVPACADGTTPSRYIDVVMQVDAIQQTTTKNDVETFNYSHSIEYFPDLGAQNNGNNNAQ